MTSNRNLTKEEQTIKITVLCEPVAKARPRATVNKKTGKIFVYTPDRTSEATNLIRDKVSKLEPFSRDTPLSLEVWIYRSRPKSIPKKQKYPINRPDADNYAKLITDALEKFVFIDDAQLVDVIIHKRYSQQPKIEITVKPLEQVNV